MNTIRATFKEGRLVHPPTVTPLDLLTFVYLDQFEDDWKKLHPNDTDEMALSALETAIMVVPEGPPVIAGTGGLRKLRWIEGEANKGKRGGIRVCYAYFPDHNTVLMVIAYGKTDKDNLTADQKKAIAKIITHIQNLLEEKTAALRSRKG